MNDTYCPVYATDYSRRQILTFADTLSIDPRAAVGTWILLNLWCQENAPEGHLQGLKPTTIAIAVGLPANQGPHLIDALTSAGLLDEQLQLLDWTRYGGRVLDYRRRKAESMRTHRSQPPPRGRRVTEHTGNTAATVAGPLPPSLKEEEEEVKPATSWLEAAAGGESRAHEVTRKVNAIIPHAITTAADADRMVKLIETFPDVDHLFELHKMFLKTGDRASRRSWVDRYISWVTDGRDIKQFSSSSGAQLSAN